MDSLFGCRKKFENEDISIALIILVQSFISVALQGPSGSNLIDITLQDNVLIGSGIFPYIYNVGSNFNLYSIISNGLIPGGQNLSRRQSVFFLPVDPRKENHKDPEYIDYSVPRHARYLQNAWKNIKIRYCGSILILESSKKG